MCQHVGHHLLMRASSAVCPEARCCGWQVPYIQVEPHTKSHAFHLALTAVVGLASYQA